MTRSTLIGALVVIVSWAVAVPGTGRADELPEKVKTSIDKGLKWVVGQQHEEGNWSASSGRFPVAMTALSGMALLMEGSTLREGKYRNNIRRAVDFLVARSQENGLLGDPNNGAESQRYMYGHGYSMLFLACVYGEEEDAKRRKKLEDVLTRAVKFSGRAQTERGGWGYVSAADGDNFDEGSTTITQLQGLRAARDAGIVVPSEVIDNAKKYLKKSTLDSGALYYNLAADNGRIGQPALTAAALAGSFSAGEYGSTLGRKWLNFCRTNIPVPPDGGLGHEDYTHYYYAQSLYVLGEKGYARLYPKASDEEKLTWSKYRDAMYSHLVSAQDEDGKWDSTGQQIGPIFSTAINLTILQLDKGALPFYQR
jgi:hypothetical protein